MTDLFVSTGTAITIAIGAVIAIAFLTVMAKALLKVAATIDDPEPDGNDAYAYSFLGAIIAVIASSATIVFYGVAPSFLYVGIILAMFSPIAVTYALYCELRE